MFVHDNILDQAIRQRGGNGRAMGIWQEVLLGYGGRLTFKDPRFTTDEDKLQ